MRINLYKVAGNRCGHVPFLGCHVEVNPRSEDFVAGLVLRLDLFQSQRRIVKHPQLQIAARGQNMSLPIGL